MPSPALFVAGHIDDEVWMAVSMAEHVAAGQDVHLLWMTDGTASGVVDDLNGIDVNSWWGVAHSPAAEGYVPLTPEMLGAARIAEGTNAVRQLALGYPGTLTIHRAQLQDGQVAQAAAQAAIVAVADLIAPAAPVRLKGHTYVPQLEPHPDHLAIGQAIKALGDADPTRFGDRRYYLLPDHWTDPDLNLVVESWDLPTDAGVTARVRNAVRCYGAWSPPYTYAIGEHSVHALLTTIYNTPKCMLHA